MVNARFHAGERINKSPTFFSVVDDTRALLAWLKKSYHCKLTAQLKAEKLVVVPVTADGFRDAVSALRSLDGKSGESFHTYSFPAGPLSAFAD
jgi:hypothetical protein